MLPSNAALSCFPAPVLICPKPKRLSKLATGRASQRGKGLATPFAALIQLLAHQHWNPDWIWGFIEPAKVQRGYAQKIGYTQMAAQGTHYQGTPKGISTDDWFVCLSRAELQARVGVGVS